MDTKALHEEARGLAEMAVERGKVETPLPGGFFVTFAGGWPGGEPQLCGLVSPAFIGAEPGESEGGETSPPSPAYSLSLDHAAHGHPSHAGGVGIEYPGDAALAHFAEWAPRIRAFLLAAD